MCADKSKEPVLEFSQVEDVVAMICYGGWKVEYESQGKQASVAQISNLDVVIGRESLAHYLLHHSLPTFDESRSDASNAYVIVSKMLHTLIEWCTSKT